MMDSARPSVYFEWRILVDEVAAILHVSCRLFQAAGRRAPNVPDQATRKKRISTRSGKRAPVPMNRLSVIQASAGCDTSKVGAQRK